MRTIVLVRSAALRLCALPFALGSACSMAATLEVSVVDDRGRPIAAVAVYATPAHADAHGAPDVTDAMPAARAVMDQRNMQFMPHLLVVQSGTSVTFPNSDDVSHHVYSFSEAKQFELPLYKGEIHAPIVFEEPGVVVLGCNIHDGMLGYVVVVDTPHFAQTDEEGVARIDDLPSGEYVVAAWTPRVRPAGLPQALRVSVSEDTRAAEIRIAGRLAPAHQHGASSLTWERY